MALSRIDQINFFILFKIFFYFFQTNREDGVPPNYVADWSGVVHDFVKSTINTFKVGFIVVILFHVVRIKAVASYLTDKVIARKKSAKTDFTAGPSFGEIGLKYDEIYLQIRYHDKFTQY